MKTIDGSANSYTKAIAYLLGFITAALVVYILIVLQEILLPFTIAIFLTYLFHPLIEYLRERRIPKWMSLIFILIVTFLIYYLMVLLFVSSFSSFPEKAQVYENNISKFLTDILTPFNLTLRDMAALFNFNVKELDFSSIFQGLFKAGIIQNVFTSISTLLKDFFVTMIFWIFMVLGKSNFEERIKVAFLSKGEKIDKTIQSFNTQLQSYIVIKTIVSFIVGAFATILFLIYGVDFALIWGLLTFILNFIPNIGSLIAITLPVLISLVQYGLGIKTISFAVLLIVIHNIMGNLVEPNYLGRQMDLSPVFVLLSLIFWGWIWGIAGMFLSVPIAAAMKILFANIKPLQPIAVLMGNKAELIVDEGPNPNKTMAL